MLAKAKRICRQGGKIVIVNRFTTDLTIIGSLTEALDPFTRRLGWRTKLKLEPFLQATDLTVEEIYRCQRFTLHGNSGKGGLNNGLRQYPFEVVPSYDG